MSEREQLLLCIIYLMRLELRCLRSVLSEFDGDKSEFVQFNAAEAYRQARENVEGKV